MKLTGNEAIEAKRENNDIVLNKYSDPTEGARENISIEDAEEIAREDESLIWAEEKTIILDGKYEAHPAGDSWSVVNSETGNVRSEDMSRDDAIACANELNAKQVFNEDLKTSKLTRLLDLLESYSGELRINGHSEGLFDRKQEIRQEIERRLS